MQYRLSNLVAFKGRNRFTFFLFAIMIVLFSCNHHRVTLGRTALRKYISDPKNGLLKEKSVNGVTVRVSYQPVGFMVCRELDGSEKDNTKKASELEKKYERNYYFLLTYSKEGNEAIRQLGSFSRYSEMVQVFSFEMQKYVNITTALNDTIPLSDYLFNQTYGLDDGNTILLSFQKEPVHASKWIDVNIAECGLGTGNIKFSFKRDDLAAVPLFDYAVIK